MALSWGKRRKALYTAVAGVVGLVVLAVVYITFFNAAPTCFDNAQNGTETGVDCGGGCSALCKSETHAAKVLWSRVFLVGAGNYTAAAYVQNPNPGAGAKRVPYSFQLFDSANSLVLEKTGTVDLPPVQTIPIIVTGIDTGTRAVSKTLFSFGEEPQWAKVGSLPVMRLGNQFLAADASQLTATLSNESLQDASKVEVDAVLFDRQGVARAASRTQIGKLPRKSSQQIVFTWPGGVPDIVRAEITVLPSF